VRGNGDCPGARVDFPGRGPARPTLGSRLTSCWCSRPDGVLVNKMNTTPDGKVPDVPGRKRRVHSETTSPTRGFQQDEVGDERRAAQSAVSWWSRLPQAVCTLAFKAATGARRLTVILAQTVKGWTIDALRARTQPTR